MRRSIRLDVPHFVAGLSFLILGSLLLAPRVQADMHVDSLEEQLTGAYLAYYARSADTSGYDF